MVVDDDEQRACTAAAAGDGGGDDHLSGLPDDVLLDILEKVVVMDGDAHAAARTCILSRRWRHLPWHNVTNVSLDVDDFIPDKEHAWRPVLQAHHRRATENLAAALASFLAAPLSKRVSDKLRLKLVLTTDDDHVHRVGALVGDAFDTGRVKAGAVELEILAESACTFVDDDDKKRLMLGYGRRFSRLRRACPARSGRWRGSPCTTSGSTAATRPRSPTSSMAAPPSSTSTCSTAAS